MADSLDYSDLLDDALRGVMARALERVARHGLPGEHHFYITFLIDHPGVRLSADIRARHDDELTIVIQNQFWDLETDAAGFSVGLAFGGKPQTVRIPFKAVSRFIDPSVKFALTFESRVGDADAEESRPDDGPAAADNVIALDNFREK